MSSKITNKQLSKMLSMEDPQRIIRKHIAGVITLSNSQIGKLIKEKGKLNARKH